MQIGIRPALLVRFSNILDQVSK